MSPVHKAAAALLLALLPLQISFARAQGESEAGRVLAQRLCAQCHMNEGQGEGASPAGIPGFAAVAGRPGQTAEGIERWLRSVPTSMPNHHLSQQEMSDLATFIMTLGKAR